mgnify:FL=1
MFQQIDILQSTNSNVKKFVFTNDEGDRQLVAEAVLYKYPTYDKRTVICCSVQSGCPIGCSFCGTGEVFIRNLTASEIINQVHICIDDVIRTDKIYPSDMERLQIMFMSMGEPMLNWKNTQEAIRELNEEYPNASLLVSTVAPDTENNFIEFTKLSSEIDNIGLQFSIHESTNEKRNLLVPFKSKWTLEQISMWGSYWAGATGRRPFFNYCVHDENNSIDDAARLEELFPPEIWECTISVICESDETVIASLERQKDLANNFAGIMCENGFSTRVFDPAGQDDIGGGCGQLWFVQQWLEEHAK